MWYNYYSKRKEETTMLKKFINYFNLNKPYEFDITDVIAPIYTTCAIGIMLGLNMNILFLIGAAIATATCWKARRLNLLLLNGAMFALNLYNVIMMFV
jgi:hypothetical protein